MGMDLCSKHKCQGKAISYHFNWHGWGCVGDFLDNLGCDVSEFRGSNDGDLVSPETCLNIANSLDSLKGKISHLITCPLEELPLHIGEIVVMVNKEDAAAVIIERRMKGENLNITILNRDDTRDWNVVTNLAYYFGFGDFCRACFKLGGFVQG